MIVYNYVKHKRKNKKQNLKEEYKNINKMIKTRCLEILAVQKVLCLQMKMLEDTHEPTNKFVKDTCGRKAKFSDDDNKKIFK